VTRKRRTLSHSGEKDPLCSERLFPKTPAAAGGIASLRQFQDLLGQIHDADSNRETWRLRKNTGSFPMQYEAALLIDTRCAIENYCNNKRKKPDSQKV
jgi:hypothetical protein